ncbi:MAG: DUF294 nucleotidyltransferase-like domain-containing protein [Planctomycetota bacterium]|nr:DUF294 nucleotidyltransferase-like domain-containing protein [Planctomycetota bacterium]MCX8039886.1 DUF294 nucleotidyltransferase-like domain-containing protein [Planctomycetota bacterium]MDW8372155.1 DUF294 nucleotidyltransferase-like domain-containing protein [Planctomycetota bacterium]
MSEATLSAPERALISRFGAEAVQLLEAVRPFAARLPEADARLADLAALVHDDPAGAASLRALLANPELALLPMRLAGISRYAFAFACRVPGVFWQIIEENQHAEIWGRAALRRALDQELAAARGPAQRQAALARFKHRQWLRVLLGEACGLLGFEAIVGELSDAVDALIGAAWELARAEVAERGEPPPFCVLALGKLGGRELNYSSDVDLLFVYEAGDEAERAHAQACRLGRALIRWLEGGDGERLLRVDMRLRPEGERGELSLSRQETVDYYWTVGRPWERQALLKARPVAGDLALGQRLLDELAPWIWPQEPRWEDIEETRAMRRRIEERARSADVKTGAGGIRDIEFLVQHLQLLYGGRLPELRLRATLPALRVLADRGILPQTLAEELTQHLIWLRTLEHRLQCWEDRQEHEVPSAPAARASLAARCGYAGAQALARFEADLMRVRERVRTIVDAWFLGRGPADDAAFALLVQGEASPQLAERLLSGRFRDPASAARWLRALAEEPFFILSRARTERALLAVLPGLLDRLAATADPERALANVARIVAAVGGRAIFYELLAQRPAVLDLLVALADSGDLLAELIERHHGLPDELADALARPPLRAVVLHGEARALMRGLADPLPSLAFLVARELAVAAARQLRGAEEDLGARLALINEVAITATLAHCLRERARAWGVPEIQGRPARFCVLALGKLGGREMSWCSDADVLFVCDAGGVCPRSGREGEAFWERVAQDLIRGVAELGIGPLDARLRPWGEQGPLVATLPLLGDYWRQPREAWERMAHLRASYLAGDPQLAAEALQLLRQQAIAAPAPADLQAQVAAMRQRLEATVAGSDDLKRGIGGYVDAEFVAQALFLGLPAELLPDPPSTAACLRRLAELGRLAAADAETLLDGLRALRDIENRLRLAAGRPLSAVPADPAARGQLARRCGWRDAAAFDEALRALRQRVRAAAARALSFPAALHAS